MVLQFVGEYVVAFLFKTLHLSDEGFFRLYKIPNSKHQTLNSKPVNLASPDRADTAPRSRGVKAIAGITSA